GVVLRYVAQERPDEVGRALVPLLGHRDRRVADEAAAALGAAGSAGPLIDEALIALMGRVAEEGDAEESPAGAALRGLARLDHPDEVTDALLRRIGSTPGGGGDDPQLWFDLLARVAGREVPAAAEALAALRKHPRVAFRRRAARALRQAGPADL